MKRFCVILFLVMSLLLLGCGKNAPESDPEFGPGFERFKLDVATFQVDNDVVYVAANITDPGIVRHLPKKASNEQYVLIFSAFSPVVEYNGDMYGCEKDIQSTRGVGHLLIMPRGFDPKKGLHLLRQELLDDDQEVSRGTI